MTANLNSTDEVKGDDGPCLCSALRRQRKEGHHKFKVNLVYITCSRPARVTQPNTLKMDKTNLYSQVRSWSLSGVWRMAWLALVDKVVARQA